MLDNARFLKNFKLVRYEDIVAKPADVVMDLFKFLGLDPEESQFDFQSDMPIRNIDGKTSPILNFNQKSFDRIPPDVFKEITTEIKPVMERLGYQV